MHNSAQGVRRRSALTWVMGSFAAASLVMPTTALAAPLPIPEDPQTMAGIQISSWHGDQHRSAASQKEQYAVGDTVIVTFKVRNESGKTVEARPIQADLSPFAHPGTGNCRWGRLPSPDQYHCKTARHLVTDEDVRRGFFSTDSLWDITPVGESTQRIFAPGIEINIGQRQPAATVTVGTPTYTDTNANQTVDTEDTISLEHTVRNSGNVTLTQVVVGTDPLGIAVNPGDSATHTVTRTLTEAEVIAGQAQATPADVQAHNGSLAADVEQATAPEPLALTAGTTGGDASGTDTPATGGSDNGSTPVQPVVDPDPYAPAPLPENGYEERMVINNGGGPDRLRNHRIPAIIQLNNGHILVSYDGRPNWGDSPQPNWIIQQRSVDGGRTFQERTIINQGRDGAGRIGYSDPSYVYDSTTGTLFNFHVYSKDVGVWDAQVGVDDNDRRIMSANMAVSNDHGRTWTNRSVTSVIKAGNIRGVFATSGNGMQKRFAPHAGRLIQPFVVVEGGQWKAVALYSDDHGATWQRGGFVGTNMDENKMVELSDGTLMLNSRIHANGSWRYVATSTDGGVTWSEVTTDHTLIDPRNNAALIAMNPKAQQGTREAKELLFSNAASTNGRRNGSIRYSCDDGKTWPVIKTYRPGAHAYSSMTALEDGTFGLFFEAESDSLWFGRFTREWLNPFCANFAPVTVSGNAGDRIDVPVQLRNDDTRPLPAGHAEITVKYGQSVRVETPALAVGEQREITIPLQIDDAAAKGLERGEVVITAGDFRIRGDVELSIEQGGVPKIDATIVPSVIGGARDVTNNPYQVGEQIPFNFLVTSTGNATETIVPAEGNLRPFLPDHGRGNCRWRNLAPGAHYNCNTPKYTVTAEDFARGYIAPTTVWEISATGFDTVRKEVPTPEISLKERTLAADLRVENTRVSDTDSDGFHEVGDTVEVDIKLTNTSTVTADNVYFQYGNSMSAPTADVARNAHVVQTWTHVITADDLAAGTVTFAELAAQLTNGSLERVIDMDDVTVPLTVEEPQVPTAPAQITLSATEVAQGGELAVTGTGFTPHVKVRIELHSTPRVLGETEADDSGAISFDTTVPADTEAGDHTVKAFAEDADSSVDAPLAVRAANTASDDTAGAGDSNAAGTGDTSGGTPADNTGSEAGGNTSTDNSEGEKPADPGTSDTSTGSTSETAQPVDNSGAATQDSSSTTTSKGDGQGTVTPSTPKGEAQQTQSEKSGTTQTKVSGGKVSHAAGTQIAQPNSLALTGSTALTILAVAAALVGLGGVILFLKKK